jgi:hypothetical protein
VRFFNAVFSGASETRPLYVDSLPEHGPVVPEITIQVRNGNDKIHKFAVTVVDTGSKVKALYHIATGVPVDQQILILKGKIIRDALTLEEQGVHGDTEFGVIRPSGRRVMHEDAADEIPVKLVAPGGKVLQVGRSWCKVLICWVALSWQILSNGCAR